MATAPTNKLPTFGSNAQTDPSIVNDTSTLKSTGFQPNTVIDSAQVNTYVKTLLQAERGLLDFFYEAGVGQSIIDANSNAALWSSYIKQGFDKKIETVRYAEALKNARTITLEGQATGSVSFDGSENVTIHTTVNRATVATALTAGNVGNETRPVYFSANGLPAKTNMCKKLVSARPDDSSQEDGKFLYGALSEIKKFIAYVELTAESTTLASGIMRFERGIPASVLNDTSYNYSTSTVRARISRIYGRSASGGIGFGNIVVDVMQLDNNGEYSAADASLRPTLTIYKLYEID